MKFRTLGKTGLQISEVAFGCGDNGGLMIAGDQATRNTVVAKAVDAGINLFDTAAHYGGGSSETNLGVTLKETGRRPYVATKVRIDPGDTDLEAVITKSLEASLQRLQMDSVEILYLHNRVAAQRRETAGGPLPGLSHVSEDDVLGPKGILGTFEKLVQQGKARWLGICTNGSEVGPITNVLNTGRFHLIQAQYNLLNPTEGHTLPAGSPQADYGQTIPLAAGNGMGVVSYRALAAGALAQREGAELRLTPSRGNAQWNSDIERAKALGFLKGPNDPTLAAAAVRYALTNPQVTTVLMGFNKAEYIDQMVDVVDRGPLGADEMARIDALYATDFGLKA